MAVIPAITWSGATAGKLPPRLSSVASVAKGVSGDFSKCRLLLAMLYVCCISTCKAVTIKSTYVQHDHMVAPMLFETQYVLQPIIIKLLSIA